MSIVERMLIEVLVRMILILLLVWVHSLHQVGGSGGLAKLHRVELASRAAGWLGHIKRRLLALSALVERRRSKLLGLWRWRAEDSLERRHVTWHHFVSRDGGRPGYLLNAWPSVEPGKGGGASGANFKDRSLRTIHLLMVLRLLLSNY